jgi:hypothetical protein
MVLTTTVMIAVAATTGAQAAVLKVDDPRPLAEAIRQFEAEFGWLVTYEDPRYQHERDLKDVTDAVRKPAAVSSSRRVIVPRGGAFVYRFERPPANASRTQVASILASMVDEFNRLDYAGKFKVVTTARMIHVVPISVRSTSGEQAPQRSILDTHVSPSAPGRNAVEGLQALLTAVHKATGYRVVLGAFPINRLVQSRMADSAKGDTVRDILERTLHESGRKVSWRVFYSPEDQTYILNLALLTQDP